MGREFRGVVNVLTNELLLFQSEGRHGAKVLESKKVPIAEAGPIIGDRLVEQVMEELELLAEAGDPWDLQKFLDGKLSPVFWGSAMTNFGVEPLLSFLAEHAAPPMTRTSMAGETLKPDDERFTGFIFKIQANMNPRHRDRIAFLRVVSGRFERGMEVTIGRNEEKLKLAKPHSFMAQERAIVEEAWPGDIVGLYDPGKLRIGDTIATGEALRYDGIPRFAPEFFARAVLKDPMKRKQLAAGLEQLSLEGVVQLFYRPEAGRQDPWLGVVGLLQFEVLKERLKNEYRVKANLERLQYTLARWVGGGEEGLQWLRERRDYRMVEDRNGNPVVLASSPWPLDYARREVPTLELHDVEPL